VRDAFKSELGPSVEDRFGFVALLPLPDASVLPECRLMFAISPKGSTEYVSAPSGTMARNTFVDAAKLVLATLNPEDPDFAKMMSDSIGPAVQVLWARERASKTRAIKTSLFGEPGPNPFATVVVPIYGRSDFMKYQLALFANDPDFRSGAVELVYFIDDPRLIDDVLRLSRGWEPVYRVPMVVA